VVLKDSSNGLVAAEEAARGKETASEDSVVVLAGSVAEGKELITYY
jgi:hypothetical protein